MRSLIFVVIAIALVFAAKEKRACAGGVSENYPCGMTDYACQSNARSVFYNSNPGQRINSAQASSAGYYISGCPSKKRACAGGVSENYPCGMTDYTCQSKARSNFYASNPDQRINSAQASSAGYYISGCPSKKRTDLEKRACAGGVSENYPCGMTDYTCQSKARSNFYESNPGQRINSAQASSAGYYISGCPSKKRNKEKRACAGGVSENYPCGMTDYTCQSKARSNFFESNPGQRINSAQASSAGYYISGCPSKKRSKDKRVEAEIEKRSCSETISDRFPCTWTQKACIDAAKHNYIAAHPGYVHLLTQPGATSTYIALCLPSK